MTAAADRLEFAPPPPGGLARGLVLAVLAHLLLVAALTWGLQWQRESRPVVAEAELWSATPQQAAPREVLAPPPPPPPPVAQPVPRPEPPVQRDADIALEREKRQREAAERKQDELERERARQQKLGAQRKRDEELQRKQEAAKAAAETKRKEAEQRRKQQEAEEKQLAQQRERNLKRMQGLAGGTGAPDAKGSAAQSAGPSASWAGKVQARVRPNIVFTDDAPGNPKAEVEVRTAPNGTIVGKRLVKSSGVKAWDDAVLRALDKTEALPHDVDGRVPSPVVIEFRPRG